MLGLLFLLLLAILLALWLYKRRRHSSKDTTSSNEPINELDNDVEWMDFENPSMYDTRASNEDVHGADVGNSNASNGNLNPPSPRALSVATVSSGMVDLQGLQASSDAVSQHESIHSMHSEDGSVRFSQQAPSARNSRDSRVLSGAAATAISMIGRRSMSKKSEGKRSARFKKNSSKKAPPPIPKTNSKGTLFKIKDNQNVATVLNRVIGKLRKDIRNVEHWTETDDKGVQQAPPDITINMPITSSNTSISSEKGLKTIPGNRLLYMPTPKLHDPPRGWAPASHNVPRGGIKSSWGKAKNTQMLNAMKAQEIPMGTETQNGQAAKMGETV